MSSGSDRGSGSNVWRIVRFWLVTRVALAAWVPLCAIVLPPPPKPIPAWAAGDSLGEWLARLLLVPWFRWDSRIFAYIADHGYAADNGTLSFHPLYPMLGRLATEVLGGPTLLGLFVVSNVCCLLFLLCLERLARLDLTREEAFHAALYFMLLPAGFILFAPYTEPLFLLLSAVALLMARRGRWALAGGAGGLAVLTRQQGILLLAPLVWELWESSGRNPRKLLASWRAGLGLLLVPAGLLVWLVYRALAFGDLVIDPSRPYTAIYGAMISQSATRIVPQQTLMPPWEAVWFAANIPHYANLVDLVAGITWLIVLTLGARTLWRLRPSYFLYSLVVVAVSFSLSTGDDVGAYMGLPRHCLLAFPLALPVALWGRTPAARRFVLAIGALFLFGMSFLHASLNWWVP